MRSCKGFELCPFPAQRALLPIPSASRPEGTRSFLLSPAGQEDGRTGGYSDPPQAWPAPPSVGVEVGLSVGTRRKQRPALVSCSLSPTLLLSALLLRLWLMAVCSLWPCGIVEANSLPALRSQRGDPRKHGGRHGGAYRTRLCAWAVIATGPVVMVTLAAGKAQPWERKEVRWQEAKGGRKAEWRGSALLVGRRGFNVGGTAGA